MSNFGEDLKKIFLLGIGAIAVTSEKSKELVDELVKKGELTLEQGKVLNEELKRDIKEKIKDNVSVTVVKKEADVTADTIVDSLGSMSKEDIEAIKAKLDELDKSCEDKAKDEPSEAK